MSVIPVIKNTLSLAIVFIFAATLAVAQQVPETRPDDVIRVKTELVQTAVTVTDSKGNFVNGLMLDQFKLLVDGKPQPITFLEQVLAGSLKEERLVTRTTTTQPEPERTTTVSRGRTIVFFIDDLHLSLQSLDRTRQTINHFIDSEMTSRDYAAIASASGRVGFLQQFTNNKQVLRAAANRLNYHPYLVRGIGMGGAPMSEYMALIIDNRSDPKLTDVYIEECMRQTSALKKDKRVMAAIRATCETQVKSNARNVLLEAASVTQDTYISLETLMRSSARRPGRKLAFFFSDGFLLDAGQRGPDLMTKLRQITDAAQRSGVVIYTIDAKGLVSTALDATNNRVIDANGRLESAMLREIAATQDALHALAGDTGGRALRNQNVFDKFIAKVLDETSNYYLVAWRPGTEEQKERKFRRVEVSVMGRPELTVRLPRGYFDGSNPLVPNQNASIESATTSIAAAKTPETDLRDALSDSQTTDSLPTQLSLSYLNTPANGMVVTSAMQIPSRSLDYGTDRKQAATVDLAGVVLNDKGKVVTSFKQRLSVDPPKEGASPIDRSGVIYNHKAPVPPGMYQVRVAAREGRSSRVGSAMEWIVVPDLQKHELALSSLLIGGQVLETASSKGSSQTLPQVQFSVDRRFSRASSMAFWLFIYNAMRDPKLNGKPDLAVQVQVLRDGQALVSTPKRKLKTDGMADLERIPYGGDVALKGLTAGRYELRVTVTDLLASKVTTLTRDFEVE